ncbi:MAG: 4-hydroxythreonine-4-phosphate dehydrogenase PdxA [Pyrinomonadaceae bacterium]|nr:4-hydroxythreonine-4-phosphate dehydrogenase PdxA [Pyrinomonadaceae bacterium]
MAERIPTIGITMGDAAGIGPEVVVKALADGSLRDICDCKVIGDRVHLERIAVSLGIDTSVLTDVCDLKNLPGEPPVGVDDAVTGRAAAESIIKAVDLWRSGEIDAIATAPISKKSIRLGGYDFQGHTEFLASLTDTERFAMSFFGGGLRVVLLSTHLPLRDAIDLIKFGKLVDLIEFSSTELSKLLKRKVKIAVAGLNPHASEGGMFGSEEADEIIPAIENCKKLGVDVSGPYSPDTVFLRCSKGEFDVCIALYHDQATIPVKALAFNAAVNVTLGLPLIRTSVDHGTAYDIAGKGIAESASMTAAIRLAAELAAAK